MKNTYFNNIFFEDIIKVDKTRFTLFFLNFCLHCDSNLIKRTLIKFGLYNPHKCERYNLTPHDYIFYFIMLNDDFKQRNALRELFFFFNLLVESVQNFKFHQTENAEDFTNFLNLIIYDSLNNDRILIWNGHSIKIYRYDSANKKFTYTEEYHTKYKEEKCYIVIDGFEDDKINVKGFVKEPQRAKLSDYKRFSNFYKSIEEILFPNDSDYCSICNPYPILQEGKVPKYCKNCTNKIIKPVNKFLKMVEKSIGDEKIFNSENALNNIKAALTKKYSITETSKFDLYEHRKEDFTRIFNKQLTKNKQDILRNVKETEKLNSNTKFDLEKNITAYFTLK